MPRVSVVIPVYNVAKYIEECLDSVLGQTVRDIEVICVDDGSTDGTPAILQRYAQNDSRIKLLSQQNAGGAAARNYGMTIATGEYLIFLDSDDCFDLQLLEKTCDKADKYGADTVLFGCHRYDDEKGQFFEKPELPNMVRAPQMEVFSALDAPDGLFNIVNPAPWVHLYRRSFVLETGLRFQEQPNSNDYFFVQATLALAKRICIVNEALTFYRVNMPGSTQGKKYKAPLCSLKAVDALYDTLVERGVYEPLRRAFASTALSSIRFNLRTMPTEQARREIFEMLEQYLMPKLDLLGHEREWYQQTNDITYNDALAIADAMEQYAQERAAREQKPAVLAAGGKSSLQPKVSVVLPVYNTREYLADALRSLTEQTLREIEIVCVDDGSTDGSAGLLREWAEQDGRIVVYSQPNQKQGVARNTGMRAAKGEYMLFLDSDDMLEKDALEQLYERASAEKLDMLYYDGRSFYENEEMERAFLKFKMTYIRKGLDDETLSGPEFLVRCSMNRSYVVSACMVLMRREFILQNGILFRPGVIHEDNAFTFAAMIQAGRVSYINRQLYLRRVRPDSTMTRELSFKNIYGAYMAWRDMQAAYDRVADRLTEEQKAQALARVGLTYNFARSTWNQVQPTRRYGYLGMGVEREHFNITIVMASAAAYANRTQNNGEQVRKLKEQLAKKNEQLARKNEKIKQLEGFVQGYEESASWRVGRMITALPRKCKALLGKIRRG